MEEITSVKELIEALGGTTVASTKLGAKYPTVVSNWIKRGNIPSRFKDAHEVVLRKHGISAHGTIWGQVAPRQFA